jgi:hypothetical protein
MAGSESTIRVLSSATARRGEETVGSITERVNRLRIEAGEKPLKPRKVGAILKNLGVKTISLGNWGRGIELTVHFRRLGPAVRDYATRHHELDGRQGGYGGTACDLCVEFDLAAGLRPSPAEPKRRRAKLFSASELDEVQDLPDDARLD